VDRAIHEESRRAAHAAPLAALDLLLHALQVALGGKSLSEAERVLGHELVVRESAAPPPPA